MPALSKYNIFYSIFFIAVLGSCTEPIDIKLASSYSRLAVYGEITTDTTVHSIKLTRSADYFYNLPAEGVSGALVKITDGIHETLLTENSQKPGVYETPPDYFGVPGSTYFLFIQNVDINKDGIMESYSASSYLPWEVTPDSLGIKYVKFSRFATSQILLYSRDPAATKDFYAFKVKKNRILLSDSLPKINVVSDELFNGKNTNGIPVLILHEDKLSEQVVHGDTLVLEVYGVTQEYYDFITDAQTELFGSNPLFSGPPANIPTNLTNGAIGFFAALNVKRVTTIAPVKP